MAVISVSIPDELLRAIDAAILEMGYSSRSEFIREAIQARLQEDASSATRRIVVVLSNHRESPGVDQRIMATAYRAAGDLLGLYHQVVDDTRCVTVILLANTSASKAVLSRLRKLRGVERVWSMTF